MKHRVAIRTLARTLTAAIALTLVSGCLWENDNVGPPVHPTASIGLPNPTGAVFANCRALVCTQADVPSCDFDQVLRGVEAHPVMDRVHCARSQYGTDCEERRAPGGGENQPAENEVLKFRCAGDPVECWMIGGNATWETTLDPDKEGGLPLQYPCESWHIPFPKPGNQTVPGPSTV
ncbi:MAG: hypothetical protein ACLQDV_17430 [Candidatus Binataceae bacterium]